MPTVYKVARAIGRTRLKKARKHWVNPSSTSKL